MNAGDRIIYTRGSPLDKATEHRGVYVMKLKGNQCRVLVDGAAYPADTVDTRVRLDDSAATVGGDA